MQSQTLRIDGWLPEQLANGPHGHWSTRQKKLKAAQTMVWASAKHADWKRVEGRARLTIVLVFSNHRRRDADNLHTRVKGCVDGLREWLVDDSTDWLELIVRAEVRPGERAVEMTLEAL